MKILIGLVSALLLSTSVCFAQVPEGGGTTTVKTVGDTQVLWHDFFTLYNVGTTAVYDEYGHTGTDYGWVKVSSYSDSLGIETIFVTMPTSGTVTLSVEGRFGDIGTGSVLFSQEFGSSDDSSSMVPIIERPDYIRTSLVNSESETESIIVRLRATQVKR